MNKQHFLDFLNRIYAGLPATRWHDGDRHLLELIRGYVEKGDFDA